MTLPSAWSNESVSTQDPDNERNSATTYWNLWNESGWRREPSKAKLVAAIGIKVKLGLGKGDDAPHVVVQMDSATHPNFEVITVSKDDDDAAGDGTTLDVIDIPKHLSTKAHTFGLFRFRPSSSMAPPTPTHSYRLRPKMVNLDSISRNLFGAASMSTRSDSVSTSRRSKSVTSRYSTTDEFCFSTDTASTRASSIFGDSLGGCAEGTKAQTGTLDSVAEIDSLHESMADGVLIEAEQAVASEQDLDLQLSIARANSIDAATAMGRMKHGGASIGELTATPELPLLKFPS